MHTVCPCSPLVFSSSGILAPIFCPEPLPDVVSWRKRDSMTQAPQRLKSPNSASESGPPDRLPGIPWRSSHVWVIPNGCFSRTGGRGGENERKEYPSRGWEDHSCQSNEVVKSVGSGARLPGCELQLWSLLVMWPWTSHFILLFLSFLTYKMEAVTLPLS